MGAADKKWLANLTVDMEDRLVRDAVSIVGFWKSAPRQESLRGRLFMFLDENEIVDFERADAVTDRLMDLCRFIPTLSQSSDRGPPIGENRVAGLAQKGLRKRRRWRSL